MKSLLQKSGSMERAAMFAADLFFLEQFVEQAPVVSGAEGSAAERTAAAVGSSAAERTVVAAAASPGHFQTWSGEDLTALEKLVPP